MKCPASTPEDSSGSWGSVPSPPPHSSSVNPVVLCLWRLLETHGRSLYGTRTQSGWVHRMHLRNRLPGASDAAAGLRSLGTKFR